MATKQDKVTELVKSMIKTAFIFERPDGSRGVVLKSSPRRKGFTVGLTDLTAADAKVIGESVTEVLQTLIDPKAKEYVDSKVKTWDGERK